MVHCLRVSILAEIQSQRSNLVGGCRWIRDSALTVVGSADCRVVPGRPCARSLVCGGGFSLRRILSEVYIFKVYTCYSFATPSA